MHVRVSIEQVRDELDRDEGERHREEQPRDIVRQIHTAVFGKHSQQVQENHSHSGDVTRTNVVPFARMHFGDGQHARRLPEGMVRAVLYIRLHMVVRRGHISRTGKKKKLLTDRPISPMERTV